MCQHSEGVLVSKGCVSIKRIAVTDLFRGQPHDRTDDGLVLLQYACSDRRVCWIDRVFISTF